MDRRKFLKQSLVGCGALAAPLKVGTATSEEATIADRSIHPQYIREKIPSFEIPPYRGHSYEDRVPDTLDIAERARLGVHVLTAITDPNADYEIRWLSDVCRNPPTLRHDFNDWVQNQEGLMEALPLLRLASGDSMNSEVDPAWMKSILKSIGPDGLIYLPLEGRPWARLNASGMDPVWRSNGTTTKFNNPSVTQAGSAATSERAIGTMTVYYLRDKNPMWKAQIEKMIGRLTALTIDRGDYCYFPPGSFEPNAKVEGRVTMPLGSLWGTTWNSRLIQALAQYYRVTGYEPAVSLAAKLTAYTRFHGEIFDPEGPWLLDPEIKGQKRYKQGNGRYAYVEGLKFGGHGQGHGIALLSVLEYAVAVNNKELLGFCKASFDWAKNPGAEYGVSSLVGWFPEWYVRDYTACESCTVGDLLGVAIKLSEAGVDDYWDDIDHWMRNHFAEAQLRDKRWVYEYSDSYPRTAVPWYSTAHDAAERTVGAWSGWALPNEWVAWLGVQHCCTGNSARGLYYVWEHMLDYRDHRLRVNLLMNRASRWADVYSYIPYQGRVDLKVKQECPSVRVRAPEWIKTGSPELASQVNGKARKLGWEGRYVEVGAVKAGDKVVLTFPIEERTVRERIGPDTYTLVMKGSTVVSIDPAGKKGALYQNRARYRKHEVEWTKVQRFVSEQEIDW